MMPTHGSSGAFQKAAGEPPTEPPAPTRPPARGIYYAGDMNSLPADMEGRQQSRHDGAPVGVAVLDRLLKHR